jgi:hypothetical protein
MFKATYLNRSDIKEIIGCAANDYGGQVAIVPVQKRGMSNLTVSSGSGEYDGGDRCIGFTNSYEIDGDLLFTVGWGDGFAVRRLNDDGTMTRLFYDSNFLWRDTTSTYNHITSVAIDKINKKGVAMTYNVEGYTTFDYSGLVNGGSTFVKDPRPTHSNPDVFIGSQDTGGGYVNRVGSSYFSGLVAAGEWIYAGDHDSHHYKKIMRRNLKTGAEERIQADDAANMYPGSQPMDRNGYRNWMMYDEVNDRVLYGYYYNANFALVLDASTAKPQIVWCDMGDIGLGDDGYEQGWYIPDPKGAPNVFWVGVNSSIAKVDVTPCFSGAKATLLQRRYVESQTPGNNYSVNFRAGTKYQGDSAGQPTDRMPGYDFCPTTGDRGKAMIPGWIDEDNNRVVALLRYNDVTNDSSSLGRGRNYRVDYGSNMTRMYSTNGVPWWIHSGYGADGHGFRIWSDDYKNELIGDWSITYGDYALENNQEINVVYWETIDWFIPTGCTLSYFVSNDGGSTWEGYNIGTNHVFLNPGTSLRVKAVATGHPNKAPYKMAGDRDVLVYGSMYQGAMDPQIKMKMTRFKLKGKKK